MELNVNCGKLFGPTSKKEAHLGTTACTSTGDRHRNQAPPEALVSISTAIASTGDRNRQPVHAPEIVTDSLCMHRRS